MKDPRLYILQWREYGDDENSLSITVSDDVNFDYPAMLAA